MHMGITPGEDGSREVNILLTDKDFYKQSATKDG